MKHLRLLTFLAAAHAFAAPPEPEDDILIIAAGAQVTLDVLANDTDPDGAGTLTLEATLTGALHGTNGTPKVVEGQVVYEAGQTLVNTDRFTYSVSDGTNSVPATVTVGTLFALKGTYAGLAEATADAAPPGNLTVTVNRFGSGTASVVWQGFTYKKRITFDERGREMLTIAQRDGTTFDLQLQLLPKHEEPPQNHQITGKLVDEGIEATFALGHTLLDDTLEGPKPEIGRYASFLQGDAGSDFAEPGGFMLFNVTGKRRSARVVAQMPDAEPFSAGSPFAGKRYVINRQLYRERNNRGPGGFFSTEPAFAEAPNLVRGDFGTLMDRPSWQRKPDARFGAKYYPAGINGGLAAFRSLLLQAKRQAPPPRGEPPALGFPNNGGAANGEMVVKGGDLDATLTRSIVVKFGPKVSIFSNDLRMKVSIIGGTTMFRGSFFHPKLSKTMKFTGTFDIFAGEGRAAFRGDTTRGLVILRPVF